MAAASSIATSTSSGATGATLAEGEQGQRDQRRGDGLDHASDGEMRSQYFAEREIDGADQYSALQSDGRQLADQQCDGTPGSESYAVAPDALARGTELACQWM